MLLQAARAQARSPLAAGELDVPRAHHGRALTRQERLGGSEETIYDELFACIKPWCDGNSKTLDALASFVILSQKLTACQ